MFAKQMALVYATDLKKRLEGLYGADYGRHPEPMTDIQHLVWMCNEVIDSGDEFSSTKAHRWIGYIQGVMTARALTTVEFERKHYVELKEELAHELGLDDNEPL
jgi:hypothetical protein